MHRPVQSALLVSGFAIVVLSGQRLNAQWTHHHLAVKGIVNAVYLEGFGAARHGQRADRSCARPGRQDGRHFRAGWLWLLDSASGQARRLTRSAGMDSRPAWSPDGKRIRVRSGQRKRPVDHGSGPGDRRRETLVATPALDMDPSYAADGRSLFYSSAEAGDLDISAPRPRGRRQDPRVTTDRGSKCSPAAARKDTYSLGRREGQPS